MEATSEHVHNVTQIQVRAKYQEKTAKFNHLKTKLDLAWFSFTTMTLLSG